LKVVKSQNIFINVSSNDIAEIKTINQFQGLVLALLIQSYCRSLFTNL
jgi:hypothetical protein